MIRSFSLPACTMPGWVRLAARPGSGVGFLAASLSVQPLVTLGTFVVAGLAAMAVPKIGEARHDRRAPATPGGPGLPGSPPRGMQAS